jgi:hypothetical protein
MKILGAKGKLIKDENLLDARESGKSEKDIMANIFQITVYQLVSSFLLGHQSVGPLAFST